VIKELGKAASSLGCSMFCQAGSCVSMQPLIQYSWLPNVVLPPPLSSTVTRLPENFWGWHMQRAGWNQASNSHKTHFINYTANSGAACRTCAVAAWTCRWSHSHRAVLVGELACAEAEVGGTGLLSGVIQYSCSANMLLMQWPAKLLTFTANLHGCHASPRLRQANCKGDSDAGSVPCVQAAAHGSQPAAGLSAGCQPQGCPGCSC